MERRQELETSYQESGMGCKGLETGCRESETGCRESERGRRQSERVSPEALWQRGLPNF